MADGDLQVIRDLREINAAVREANAKINETARDMQSVNRALRFDPDNAILLEEKTALLEKTLQRTRERSEELAKAVDELNYKKRTSAEFTQQDQKYLDLYTKQLEDAQRQVIGLTGATQNHNEVQEVAIEKTKSFSESMTEFQSNLRAVKQVMSGVHSTFLLFGGDDKSAMGQMIKQSQQVVSAMSGILSMGKLLTSANKTLAISTAAAFAGFMGATAILNQFDGEGKKVAQTIGGLIGLIGALALAYMVLSGTINPFGITAAVAAIGVGVASLKSMLPTKETVNTNSSTSSSSSGSARSTPSIPSSSLVSGTASSITYVSQGNLTQQQIRDAIREGIEDSGLGNLRIIERQAQNAEVFYQLTMPEFLSANRRNGNIIVVRK
jgi:5-bromo-4-chloroindolyl phosphate hydrolysis protein